MFSLAGIPPLAGFFAKWYVFLAAINAGLYTLAVIGVLASVVGAYYYLRIIKIMWFDEPVGGFLPMSGELRVVLGVSGAFMLFYVLVGGPVGNVAQAAAKSLLLTPCAFELAPSAIAEGYRLEAHDSVGSTNALALDHAQVRRSRQAVGRLEPPGKRPRPARPPLGDAARQSGGNAALVVGSFELRLAATLGFVAGLSLSDALDAVMPGAAVGIVRRTGRTGRTAPLRAEMAERRALRRRQAGGHPARIDDARRRPRSALAVGIGVNVVAHPEDLPYPATSLARLGADVRCRGAVPGAFGGVERKLPALGRGSRPCRDPPALAVAGRRAGLASFGAHRRQCRAAVCSRPSTRTAAS